MHVALCVMFMDSKALYICGCVSVPESPAEAGLGVLDRRELLRLTRLQLVYSSAPAQKGLVFSSLAARSLNSPSRGIQGSFVISETNPFPSSSLLYPATTHMPSPSQLSQRERSPSSPQAQPSHHHNRQPSDLTDPQLSQRPATPQPLLHLLAELFNKIL